MTEAGNLTQRAFKSAAWLGGTSVLRLGLKLVSVAILARLLSPTDYGIVAAAIVATQLAALLYGLGVAPVLVQRREIRREHVAAALGTSLTMAVVTGAIMWFAAPGIAALMHIEPLTQAIRWLAFTTPFAAFRTICEALLARNMRGREVALQPLICFMMSAFLVAIPLALADYGYWALVAMQGADVIIGALVLGIAARQWLVRPGFSTRAFCDLWPMSLGFWLEKPLAYIGANADKFLIARMLGPSTLGLYSRASFLTTNATGLFSYIARIAVFPTMAQVQDDKERLRRGLVKSLSLVSLVALPISAFCIMFAEPIVGVLLGPQWTEAVVPFAILSATLYMRLGRRSCGAMFQALGRPYSLMGVQALNATAIISAILAGADLGLNIVCGLVVMVSMMTFLAMVGMACRAVDIRIGELLHLHVMPLLLSLGVVLVGAGINYLFASAPAIAVLAVGLCTIGVSVVILLYFKPQWILGQWKADAASSIRGIVGFGLQRRPS